MRSVDSMTRIIKTAFLALSTALTLAPYRACAFHSKERCFVFFIIELLASLTLQYSLLLRRNIIIITSRDLTFIVLVEPSDLSFEIFDPHNVGAPSLV